jgi:arsenate reductase (thioredoxin)
MTRPPFNVLFLCTGNSARSILAESLLNHWGQGRFRGFSADSFPKGAIHPCAHKLLHSLELPTEGLRSKSWNEFAKPDAPVMDFVFTVCDQAAGEVCPMWPGQPITAHWGMPDPAAVAGSDVEQWQAFRDTFRALENRIKIFVALPVASLDRMSLAHQVEAIGRMLPDEAGVVNISMYHNPDCGTSRNVLALIRNSGEEPRIIEYLKTPPTRDELVSLIDRMGVPARDVLRRKGTPYDALGLDNPSLTDDALIDAMMAHPILINRPIVLTPDTVKLCRPSETVLDLLPQPQRGPFVKENGEAVIDTHGNRIPRPTL